MEEQIILYGDINHLIAVLKSHIDYLEACGYEQHVELDYCSEFLSQLT